MSFWSTLGKIGGSILGTAGSAIGSLVGGKAGNVIGSVTSGLGSAIAGSSAASDDRKAQMQMLQYQMEAQQQENQKNRDWQEEMWNKQNEYNTPTNQLKLYTDAGYNPLTALNAMNGSSSAGSVGTASTSSILGGQQAIQSGAEQVNLTNSTLQASQQQALAQAQIDLARSQARKNDVEADWHADDEKSLIDLRKQQVQNLQDASAKIVQEIDNLKSEKKLIEKRADLTDSEITHQDNINGFDYSILSEQLNNWHATYLKNLAEAQYIPYNAQTNRINARANEKNAMTNSFNAQTTRMLANQSIELMQKTGLKLDAETQKIYQECVTEYWKGDKTKAEASWQKFSNRVRESNGEIFYSQRDQLDAAESVSRTLNNSASAAEHTSKTVKNTIDCFKPW